MEELNQRAYTGELDVTKISFHAFFKCLEDYELLTAGSALGFGCGPLLISKIKYEHQEINDLSICIPGENTTANLLMRYAFPKAKNKTPLLFSEIEEALLEEHFEAGVIIHENRFTYQDKGLQKIVDLGEYWETKTNLPIPLGGIAIKRNLVAQVKHQFNELLKASIQFGFDNPDEALTYCKTHAQEMNDEVMQQHIDLYVNDYSLDIGEIGKQAVELLKNKCLPDSRSLNMFVEA